MEKKMKEKKFKNSILIEGDYNFNYLTNLLFIAKTCITDIFVKKGIDSKNNKKMFKNVKHLCEFLESSIDVFSRLSIQENEEKCILHTIEYSDKIPTPVPTLEDVDSSSGLSKVSCSNPEDVRNAFDIENLQNSKKDSAFR